MSSVTRGTVRGGCLPVISPKSPKWRGVSLARRCPWCGSHEAGLQGPRGGLASAQRQQPRLRGLLVLREQLLGLSAFQLWLVARPCLMSR